MGKPENLEAPLGRFIRRVVAKVFRRQTARVKTLEEKLLAIQKSIRPFVAKEHAAKGILLRMQCLEDNVTSLATLMGEFRSLAQSLETKVGAMSSEVTKNGQLVGDMKQQSDALWKQLKHVSEVLGHISSGLEKADDDN